MDSLTSGSPWVLVDIIAVVVLGIAILYGTMNWRRRRQGQLRGPAAAPGPTPKKDEGLPDDRPRVVE
jgi:hypothetical protein